MTDLLHGTAAEYGLYFLCFPVGFCTGNVISSRLSGRVGSRRWSWPGQSSVR